MKTNISIEARRFPVTLRDERTGEIIQSSIILDKQRLQAAQLVGQSSKELIHRFYNRQGFRVLEISMPERRSLNLSLEDLWDLSDGLGRLPSSVMRKVEPFTVVMSGCVVFWMCSINSFSMVLSPHQANLTSLSAGGASCSVPAIPNWPGICGTISTTFSSSATYSMVVTAFVGTRADLTV